jgi:thiamine kinase-like enzyme
MEHGNVNPPYLVKFKFIVVHLPHILISAFFNERHQAAMDANKLPRYHPSRNDLFDNSEPLVLTHQDLNLRNLIVGEDGHLWIIDWGWAGYHPWWFEYVAMREAE